MIIYHVESEMWLSVRNRKEKSAKNQQIMYEDEDEDLERGLDWLSQ